MAHLLTRHNAQAAWTAVLLIPPGVLSLVVFLAWIVGFNTQGLDCELIARGRCDQHRREDQVENAIARAVDFARLQHLGMCVFRPKSADFGSNS